MIVIPPIGTSGLWNVNSPFSGLLVSDMQYTLIGIRYLSDILNAGEDPETEYYISNGLGESDYTNDVRNNAAILSLQGSNGIVVYISSTYVKSYPDIGGVPYRVLGLTINLGAVADSMNLSNVISKIESDIQELVGITANVKPVALSNVSIIPSSYAATIEASRLSKIATTVTDYARYITAAKERDAARMKITNLESFLFGLQIQKLLPTNYNCSGTAPKAINVPTIYGKLVVGSTVECQTGTWLNNPTSYEYQWYRGDLPINAATNSTYTLTINELHNDISCLVTARNSYGHASLMSGVTDNIVNLVVTPINTIPPLVNGSNDNNTISVNNGTWENTPTSYKYQWYSNQDIVTNATNETYQLVQANIGTVMSATVTATNNLGDTTVSSSNGIFIISTGSGGAVNNGFAPNNVIAPVITGANIIGTLLNITTGTWTNNPLVYTYQWYSDGIAINGATNNTYTLGSSDISKDVMCVVTATNAEGSGTINSNTIVNVINSPLVPINTATPIITGAPSIGSNLSCSQGSWNNSPNNFAYTWERNGVPIGGTVTYKYQWYRNDIIIPGATNALYTSVAADLGTHLTCTVTASNTDGVVSSTSIATTAIAPAGQSPVNNTLPIISGNTIVGGVLNTTSGIWSGNPTSYKYQWYSGNTLITGATQISYTLSHTDVGNDITVRVTATNIYGSTTAISAGTSPISNIVPVNTTPPNISGNTIVGGVLNTTSGTWLNNPINYTYQWYRGSNLITGATDSTYVLTAFDHGFTITCNVVANGTGGNSKVITSNTLGPIA